MTLLYNPFFSEKIVHKKNKKIHIIPVNLFYD